MRLHHTIYIIMTHLFCFAVLAQDPAIPFILDTAGDGINLSNEVTTGLFSGNQTIQWTGWASDDGFLVINTDLLARSDWTFYSFNGNALRGYQLIRGEISLEKPDGDVSIISDAWDLISDLDTNYDGQLNSSDATWNALSVFKDANADGFMNSSERISLSSVGIQSIGVKTQKKKLDQYGNILVPGTFQATNGLTRTAVSATLASPSENATVITTDSDSDSKEKNNINTDADSRYDTTVEKFKKSTKIKFKTTKKQ